MAFIRQMAGYGVAKVLPGLIGLITVPLWIRLFGDASYAMYTSIWVVTNFSASVAVGWLRQGLLRYAGNSKFSLGTVPLLTLFACVVIGAFPPVVLTIIMVSQQDSAPGIFLATIAYAVLNSLYLVVQAQTQRDGEANRYAVAEFIRAVVALAASVLLGETMGVAPASAMVGGYAISTLLALVTLRVRRSSGSRGTRTSAVGRVLWTYGWPMSIWLALAQVLAYFDRLILIPYVSAAEIGQYAAVSDLIVRGVGMVAFPITMVAHPVIMTRWNAGHHIEALRANRHFLGLTALAGLACVVVLTFAGRPLIEWLLGTPAPDLLLIVALAVGGGMWQVALQAHKPLELAGRTKLMTVMLALVCVLTLAALIMLVPAFGTNAAAVIFAMGATAYVIGSVIASRSVK
ncbi:lipopolysaccharide biosynthesis protein [Microbacterium sp. I2]|uniref:lipopolysaccharide biosynthesis protein n=1 Tax=Microbacterium sp. I2 TaxID=3391826 RepID=UPI003EDA49C7